MRNISLFFCILSFMFACAEQHDDLPQVTALYSQAPVSVDGVLADVVWGRAPSVLMSRDWDAREVSVSRQTQVKLAYDSLYLYVAFLSNDMEIWGSLNQHDQHLWTEEAVEIFLDTDQPGYFEIQVSPLNTVFDALIIDPDQIDLDEAKSFNFDGLKTAVSINGALNDVSDIDQSWSAELAIPLKEITQDHFPPVNNQWRVNFYRIDRNRSNQFEQFDSWSTTYGKFHKPEAFGKIVFQP